MKILIIGSEGFIGSHCLMHFKSIGHELFGCDILDLKEVSYPYFRISRLAPGFDDIFINHQFDVCINAAGSGSVPLSITNPYSDFEANTVDTFKILESIRSYNCTCKYVNFSSAAVYGNPVKLPVSELDLVQPLSPYGWHKYYSELICKEYNFLYHVSTCSIRPFSVYGPGLKKQLFWDIYQKTLKTQKLLLHGTGKESRDFIFIMDLVECVHLVLLKGALNGEVYNVANGIETTIEEASKLFLQFLNPSIEVSFNGEYRAGDPINWLSDNSLLKNIGYLQKVSLSVGLEKYCKWLTERK